MGKPPPINKYRHPATEWQGRRRALVPCGTRVAIHREGGKTQPRSIHEQMGQGFFFLSLSVYALASPALSSPAEDR